MPIITNLAQDKIRLVKPEHRDFAEGVVDHAYTLMNEFLDEHAPHLEDNWDIYLDLSRGTNTAGCVKWRYRDRSATLALSRVFIEEGDFEFMDDTVRHEIAHMIAGHEAGHGWRWQESARLVGAKPERCHTKDMSHVKKWKRTCPCCGKVSYCDRKTKRSSNASCGVCNPDKWDERYVLIWEENR